MNVADKRRKGWQRSVLGYTKSCSAKREMTSKLVATMLKQGCWTLSLSTEKAWYAPCFGLGSQLRRSLFVPFSATSLYNLLGLSLGWHLEVLKSYWCPLHHNCFIIIYVLEVPHEATSLREFELVSMWVGWAGELWRFNQLKFLFAVDNPKLQIRRWVLHANLYLNRTNHATLCKAWVPTCQIQAEESWLVDKAWC